MANDNARYQRFQTPHAGRAAPCSRPNCRACAPAAPRRICSIRCMVDAYGTQMPLNQVATVSVPEPRMISRQGLGPLAGACGRKGHPRRQSRPDPGDRRTDASACASPSSTRSGARNWSRSRTNMPKPRGLRSAMCGATAMDVLKKLEKDHKISEDEHERFSGRGAKSDRSGDRGNRSDARRQGKRDHDGLRSQAQCPSRCPAALPSRHVRRCRATSPSSWTAMDAGRRRAGCRAAKVTGAASRRCGARCARRRYRHRHSHHLLLQLRKLVAAGRRSPRTDGPVAALHPA